MGKWSTSAVWFKISIRWSWMNPFASRLHNSVCFALLTSCFYVEDRYWCVVGAFVCVLVPYLLSLQEERIACCLWVECACLCLLCLRDIYLFQTILLLQLFDQSLCVVKIAGHLVCSNTCGVLFGSLRRFFVDVDMTVNHHQHRVFKCYISRR